MCEKNDILVEIPDHDLLELATYFEEKAPWAPYMKAFSGTALRWKKGSEKYREALRFFSPNNCWREDGTVIITLRLTTEANICLFTLDEKCRNLSRGLSETKRLTYDLHTVFYAIHEKFIPTLKNYIQEKNLKIVEDVPCYIYTIKPEEAKKFEIVCPNEVTIEKITSSAAKRINDLWPHRSSNSEFYLEDLLDANGGYGVFVKDSNLMVAWILKHVYGNMTMLQTEEEYKRRGYAALLTKTLAKEIAEEGYYPFGTIVLKNISSMRMFQKLGFMPISNCTFIVVESY